MKIFGPNYWGLGSVLVQEVKKKRKERERERKREREREREEKGLTQISGVQWAILDHSLGLSRLPSVNMVGDPATFLGTTATRSGLDMMLCRREGFSNSDVGNNSVDVA
jgi:hypothetical protein